MRIMGIRNAIAAALLAFALAMSAQTTEAAPTQATPHLGYAYPAGGQQGTTFQVFIGGQYLRGSQSVLVSGSGVHATVISHSATRRRLKSEQRRELGRQLAQLVRQKLAPPGRRQQGAAAGRAAREQRQRQRRQRQQQQQQQKKKGAQTPGAPSTMTPVELPDHPLLRHLDQLSLRELKKVRDYFFDRAQRLQLNPQLSERLVVEVRIDKDAAPGAREIRVTGRTGLTNPLRFEVGTYREIVEEEVNDFQAMVVPALDQPLVVNGQVDVRDIDRFRFRARKAQALVFLAEARRLVPYLADAVPGWFQATLTLRDARGEEVAFVDDYQFDPDPVMRFEVPADGEYELSIRDAIDRGRRDFVYRIIMGEVPFVTGMFPLGAQIGKPAVATIAGWNLPRTTVALDTATAGRKTLQGLGHPLSYVVDELASCWETDLSRDAGGARSVSFPRVVYGRLEKRAEADVYRFQGRAGQEVVLEVLARRLGSPLDSYLELADAGGHVLAASDDVEDKAAGLCTDHADSFLRTRLPADGAYTVRLVDAERRGGPGFAYRLRLAIAQPDFALLVTPSALNVPAGSNVEVTVHLLRKEGFEGRVALALTGPAAGFSLSGAMIPAGRDKVRLTLQAPRRRLSEPMAIRLEGRAEIGGRWVSHEARAVDDMMQAFLYRHLVPAQALLVNTQGGRGTPPLRRFGPTPLALVPGSVTTVRYEGRRLPPLAHVRLVLADPPAGVTLEGFAATPDGLQFALRVADGAKVGLRDNLIVEAYAEVEQRRRGKKKTAPPPKTASKTPPAAGAKEQAPKKQAPVKRLVYVGVLPAIPVTIVATRPRSTSF